MKKLFPTFTLIALLGTSAFAQDRDRTARPERGDRDRAQPEKIDWGQIKQRIEGAVKRGDMTRDQANQKYTEIKKKLAANKSGPSNSPTARRQNTRQPNALGKVLGELMAQKKINPEDARRIFQAAYGNTGTPPRMGQAPFQRNQRRPQAQQVAEELREVLNQAKRELAELREAREHLTRRRHEEEEEEHQNREQMEIREKLERAHAAVERKRDHAMREARAQAEQKREQAMKAEQAAKARAEAEIRERQIMEQRRELERQQRLLEEKRKNDKKKGDKKKKKDDQ